MTRLPGALFIVDTMREHIAVKEAQKLNIPIFAMVDTNCDPRDVDYLIPSNDDASKSIDIIMTEVTHAIAEGLAERKNEKGDSEGKSEKKDKVKKKDAEKSEAKQVVKAAKKVEADDLTKVEGIGPKAAEALVAAGIATYADLSKGDAEKIKEILNDASSRMAHLDPTSWPKQAKMAAEGKWDELKEWQDNAKGGVE
jgi:small subunit ribosomal protein S2